MNLAIINKRRTFKKKKLKELKYSFAQTAKTTKNRNKLTCSTRPSLERRRRRRTKNIAKLKMKVTICFDDVKIIVPCSNTNKNTLTLANNASKRLSMAKNSIEDCANNKESENVNFKVIDVIENAIARYKKATAKVRFETYILFCL